MVVFYMYKAVIVGISSTSLLEEEKTLFARIKPLGFILFARNIENAEQVKRLVDSLRKCIENPQAPILIDQEGGRVARLKEPNWYRPKASKLFGDLALQDLELAKYLSYLNGLKIACDLANLGININCAPVVDIPAPGAHDVIGDRAFSTDPMVVAALAKEFVRGMKENGVTAIVKHIPGHGRAEADSHFDLPVIKASYDTLKTTDFVPFKELNNVPLAMTAHAVYESIDPENPATQSKKVIGVIRDEIGFKNLIITDCIKMDALKGTVTDRALKSFEAGCDIVLYAKCDLEDIHQILLLAPGFLIENLSLVESNFPNELTCPDVSIIEKGLAKISQTQCDIDSTDPTCKY